MEVYRVSNIIKKTLKRSILKNKEFIYKRNLFFEPSLSEITGVLTLNQFYGPPNYGETPETDTIERVWIIELQFPISVHREEPEIEEGDFNLTQYNITRVQIYTPNEKINLKKNEGKLVTVKGKIFGSHTGHHYTPVLMEIVSLDV